MSEFILAASQLYHRRFIVRDRVGIPADADVLPVAVLVRNGVDEPGVVTVTNEPVLGEYSIQLTAPASVAPDDCFQLRVSYTVDGESNHTWAKVTERLVAGTTVFRVFTVRDRQRLPVMADLLPTIRVTRNNAVTTVVATVTPHTLAGDYLVSFDIPVTWVTDDEVEIMIDAAVSGIFVKGKQSLGVVLPTTTMVSSVVDTLRIRERFNRVKLAQPMRVTLKPPRFKVKLRECA